MKDLIMLINLIQELIYMKKNSQIYQLLQLYLNQEL